MRDGLGGAIIMRAATDTSSLVPAKDDISALRHVPTIAFQAGFSVDACGLGRDESTMRHGKPGEGYRCAA